MQVLKIFVFILISHIHVSVDIFTYPCAIFFPQFFHIKHYSCFLKNGARKHFTYWVQLLDFHNFQSLMYMYKSWELYALILSFQKIISHFLLVRVFSQKKEWRKKSNQIKVQRSRNKVNDLCTYQGCHIFF
jgi:hypothetical protein